MFTAGIGRRTRPTASLSSVNRALRDLLDASGGLLHRAEALAVLPEHVWWEAVRSGRLRRLLPEVYVDAGLPFDWWVMARAAIRHTEGTGALSHTSALRVWRLPVPNSGHLHVTVADGSGLRSMDGLRMHRREGFEPVPPDVVIRAGLPVTRIEHAVVQSWPLLDRDAQRAPAIRAVAERLTTPQRLRAALENWPRIGGRRILRQLIGKLDDGCRSELEIWGYDHVFRGIPGLHRQVPIRIRNRSVYLDVFHPATGTNFELDGARYHAMPADRERDLRRDAALAARGITVVRLTHDHLTGPVADVRREVMAILASRRPAA
jgi:very-short-patch-repair endonuclease